MYETPIKDKQQDDRVAESINHCYQEKIMSKHVIEGWVSVQRRGGGKIILSEHNPPDKYFKWGVFGDPVYLELCQLITEDKLPPDWYPQKKIRITIETIEEVE